MGRKGWIAVGVVGGLLMLGPVVGILGTVVGLAVSFNAVENVDPAMKSQRLAEGISLAMNSTAVGLAVFPLGAILAGLSLFQLFRRAKPGDTAAG